MNDEACDIFPTMRRIPVLLSPPASSQASVESNRGEKEKKNAQKLKKAKFTLTSEKVNRKGGEKKLTKGENSFPTTHSFK